MESALREELFKLSAAERRELVEELWDSIADEHEALALTDEQREDLERRLAEADADPSGGSPWETCARASGIGRGDAPFRDRRRAELETTTRAVSSPTITPRNPACAYYAPRPLLPLTEETTGLPYESPRIPAPHRRTATASAPASSARSCGPKVASRSAFIDHVAHRDLKLRSWQGPISSIPSSRTEMRQEAPRTGRFQRVGSASSARSGLLRAARQRQPRDASIPAQG